MSKRNKEWDDYGIGSCNRMVMKDAAVFVGCCAVAIAGMYGVLNLSQDVIDYCNAGNIMDFKMKIEESLKISASVCSAFFGSCGAYSSGLSLKESVKFKQKIKDEIDNAPCMGIIRNF